MDAIKVSGESFISLDHLPYMKELSLIIRIKSVIC